jgi:hypothetical protein
MHNEYVTSKCILDIDDKLLLLDYENVDITDISPILYRITLNIMDQCYKHTEDFHEHNKMSPKRYSKISPLVVEQMKDMLFVKKKFIEYFAQRGPKTKSDLLTYVFGFQISEIQFDEYVFKILCDSLKDDLSEEFWDKHKLKYFELNSMWAVDHIILRNKRRECNIGELNIDTSEAIFMIDDFLHEKYNVSMTEEKLDLISKISDCILKDYDDNEYEKQNKPFKSAMTDLIKHIKVYQSMDKVSPHVKRL